MRVSSSTRDDQRDGSAVSRRTVLRSVPVAAVAGTAGCTTLANAFADAILKDVNIFNRSEKEIHGAIRVVGPGGSVALSDRFGLEVRKDNKSTEETRAVYGDVWGSSGTYEARVDLTSETASREGTRSSTAVVIDRPDEQMLGIAIDSNGESPEVDFSVADELSEFD